MAGSISRRRLAGHIVVPWRGGKCADARSWIAAAPPDIACAVAVVRVARITSRVVGAVAAIAAKEAVGVVRDNAGIGICCQISRRCVALTGHGGSCEHGSGRDGRDDQLAHRSSPWVLEEVSALFFVSTWEHQVLTRKPPFKAGTQFCV